MHRLKRFRLFAVMAAVAVGVLGTAVRLRDLRSGSVMRAAVGACGATI